MLPVSPPSRWGLRCVKGIQMYTYFLAKLYIYIYIYQSINQNMNITQHNGLQISSFCFVLKTHISPRSTPLHPTTQRPMTDRPSACSPPLRSLDSQIPSRKTATLAPQIGNPSGEGAMRQDEQMEAGTSRP